MKYFEKISYNIRDANKVLKIFKKIQVPRKATNKNEIMKSTGLGGVSRNLKEVSKVHGISIKDIKKQMSEVGFKPGMVFHSGKGDTLKTIKSLGVSSGKTKFSPKERKMADSIFKGHELDEVKTMPSRGFTRFGHNSPDVILREHNKIVTLPKTYNKVKEYAKDLRGIGGESGHLDYYVPGLKYGETPRLSRHARKKIIGIIDKKAPSFNFFG